MLVLVLLSLKWRVDLGHREMGVLSCDNRVLADGGHQADMSL